MENGKVKLEAYMDVFQAIAKSENIQSDCFAGSVQSIIEKISKELLVSRVSVWEYTTRDSVNYIKCISELQNGVMNYLGVELDSLKFPAYFDAIDTQEIVVANDARTDPATSCFLEALLIPLDIYSMLDVPFFMEGELKGVICLEHQKEYREWSIEDQFFARVMSSFISLSYKNSRIYEDNKRIEKINKELITSRNALIQTEKMAALGQVFSGVAHDINTPLGAIKASSSNLDYSFDKLPGLLFGFVEKYSKKEFELLLGLSRRGDRQYKNRKEIRDSRKKIAALLDLNNINIDGLAGVLAQLQVEVFTIEELTYFKKCDGDLVMILNILCDIDINLNVIESAVEKSSLILNSLKSFIRSNDKEERKTFSILEPIESVLNIYSSYLKNIDLKLIMPSEEVFLEGRKNDFMQMFTNILYNAIQASNYKGDVIFKVTTEGEYVFISIKDFGEGIQREIIHKVFDPLFTTKPEGEGSGIGLDVVKRLVKSYRGEVSVISEYGAGAEFIIKVPFYRVGLL